MTKDQARIEAKVKRFGLSIEAYATKSTRLAHVFSDQVSLENIKRINLFLPLTHQKEPDTLLIVKYLTQKHPHIKLSIPHIERGTKEIMPVEWTPQTPMQAGPHGTSSPAKIIAIDPKSLDMVLVPLLAFDKNGYRVGYGGGYYDRFLKTCRPDVVRLGLSFFTPVKQIDDVWEGDERLTACLLPSRIYHFT